jgi:hypothetical protein
MKYALAVFCVLVVSIVSAQSYEGDSYDVGCCGGRQIIEGYVKSGAIDGAGAFLLTDQLRQKSPEELLTLGFSDNICEIINCGSINSDIVKKMCFDMIKFNMARSAEQLSNTANIISENALYTSRWALFVSILTLSVSLIVGVCNVVALYLGVIRKNILRRSNARRLWAVKLVRRV